MSRFILSWKGFLSLTLVVTIVIGAQYCIAYVIDDSAVVANDTKCEVTARRVSDDFGEGNFVELALNCGGIEAETTDISAVIYHIEHPTEPLVCKTYRSGSIKCGQPEE